MTTKLITHEPEGVKIISRFSSLLNFRIKKYIIYRIVMVSSLHEKKN